MLRMLQAANGLPVDEAARMWSKHDRYVCTFVKNHRGLKEAQRNRAPPKRARIEYDLEDFDEQWQKIPDVMDLQKYAIILSGPAGIGKSRFARVITEKLVGKGNCCPLVINDLELQKQLTPQHTHIVLDDCGSAIETAIEKYGVDYVKHLFTVDEEANMPARYGAIERRPIPVIVTVNELDSKSYGRNEATHGPSAAGVIRRSKWLYLEQGSHVQAPGNLPNQEAQTLDYNVRDL